MIKILPNYLIFLICMVGFHGGAVTVLLLPFLQIVLSWCNYRSGGRWQIVLMLEMHLLISTVAGLALEGYLYLTYISKDAESILVFHEMIRMGFIFVLGVGVTTALLKFLQQKENRGSQSKRTVGRSQTRGGHGGTDCLRVRIAGGV